MTMPELVPVSAAPHPFRTGSVDLAVPRGTSLAEIIELAQPDPVLRRYAVVYIDGWRISAPRHTWRRIYPKRLVELRIVPTGGGGGGGGKNPLVTVLTIAVIAAAVAVSGGALGPVGLGIAGLGAGSFGAVVGGAAISAGGMLLVNSIAPPSQPKLPSSSGTSSVRDSPTLFIEDARNVANKWGVIPVVLGEHRMVPPLGARSFTEMVGDKQFLRMLVVWGYGPLEIDRLRIGDTDLDEFEGVEIEHRQGYPDDQPLTIYSNAVAQQAFSILLKAKKDVFGETIDDPAAGEFQVRTITNADEISIDLVFPQGLVRFDPLGLKRAHQVDVEVRYRPTGSSGWLAPDLSSRRRRNFRDKWILGGGDSTTVGFRGHSTAAQRYGMGWKVANRGDFDVGVRKRRSVFLGTSKLTSEHTVFDEVGWVAARAILNEDPIRFEHPLAKSALVIQVTDQLNGVVDELTGRVRSIALDWDRPSGTWIQRITSNPASLYRHVLQMPANARPQADAEINLDDLADWHKYCADNGLEFNMIRDFPSSVFETLVDVAAAGLASPAIADGTVVVDREKPDVVQHFTPRNTWDFSGTKAFVDLPHAWRVRFNNRAADWLPDERIVYRDGYDETNATVFEQLELLGVTRASQIWKIGKHRMGEVQLRPERWAFNADIEHLIARRGSRVRLTHDVMLVGLATGRIQALQTGPIGDPIAAPSVIHSARHFLASGLEREFPIGIPDEPNRKLLVTYTGGNAEVDVYDVRLGGPDGIPLRRVVKAVTTGPDATAEIWELAAPAVAQGAQVFCRSHISGTVLLASAIILKDAAQADIPAADTRAVASSELVTASTRSVSAPPFALAVDVIALDNALNNLVATSGTLLYAETQFDGHSSGASILAADADGDILAPSWSFAADQRAHVLTLIQPAQEVAVIGLSVDEPLPMVAGTDYGIVVRNAGGSRTRRILTSPGRPRTIILADAIQIGEVEVGDLFGFGEAGLETVDALVHSLERRGYETATVTCVPYSPQIFDLSRAPIPAYETGITPVESLTVPEIVSVSADERALQRGAGDTLIQGIAIEVRPLERPGVILEGQLRSTESGEPYRNHQILVRTDNTLLLGGVQVGETWDVRARWNIPGRLLPGPWAERGGVRVVGTIAAPSGLVGLTIATFGGAALLRWEQPAELDVTLGGTIQFRHSSELIGATWSSSVSIGQSVQARQLWALLPLKPGTYMARVFDAGGSPGPIASVTTKQASVLAFAPVDLLDEGPAFAGIKNGTVAFNNTLRLDSDGLVGEQPVFSAIPLLSDLGTVLTSGTYDFAFGIDLLTVSKVRLTSLIAGFSVAIFDRISQRSEPVSSWQSWSGVDDQAAADAQVWVQTTDEDPAIEGAPSVVLTSRTTHQGATTYLKTFTISEASNRKLIVEFVDDSAAIDIQEVRWDGPVGPPLTRVVKADVPAGTERPTAEIWELIDPLPGVRTISWKTGGPTTAHQAMALEIRDTAQSPTVVGDTVADALSVGATASSVTLTAPDRSLILDVIALNDSTAVLTETGDNEQLWNNAVAGNHAAAGGVGTYIQGGTATVGWGISKPSLVAHAAIALRPAADVSAFGPYQRLDSGEFEARAFQFQARLMTTDPAYNFFVTALGVDVEELA